MDNELLLFDRIEIIKTVVNKYGVDNFYLSFSGGKDSTILHYLLDLALPGNKIPRVYIDTGIEYLSIRNFVKDLASKDERFTFIKPSVSINQMLEKDGYPFKSKQHAHNLMVYQHSGLGRTVRGYLGLEKTPTKFLCPKSLFYQFRQDFKIRVSDKCCLRMKKEPVHRWENENNRPIAITGMRQSEGGKRASIKNCILTDKDGRLKRFHPLLVVNDDWEEWFIVRQKIDLCELYYPPFNFKRTGCKGCPFSLDLQEQLTIMDLYLPNERKQCEIIWKPVYSEYRRIGFRLTPSEQLYFI